MLPTEVAEVMGRPIAQELLASSIPARLAYVGRDEDPRIVPVGFLWTGEHLVVCSVPTMAKVPALRETPQVATRSRATRVLSAGAYYTVPSVDALAGFAPPQE